MLTLGQTSRVQCGHIYGKPTSQYLPNCTRRRTQLVAVAAQRQQEPAQSRSLPQNLLLAAAVASLALTVPSATLWTPPSFADEDVDAFMSSYERRKQQNSRRRELLQRTREQALEKGSVEGQEAGSSGTSEASAEEVAPSTEEEKPSMGFSGKSALDLYNAGTSTQPTIKTEPAPEVKLPPPPAPELPKFEAPKFNFKMPEAPQAPRVEAPAPEPAPAPAPLFSFKKSAPTPAPEPAPAPAAPAATPWWEKLGQTENIVPEAAKPAQPEPAKTKLSAVQGEVPQVSAAAKKAEPAKEQKKPDAKQAAKSKKRKGPLPMALAQLLLLAAFAAPVYYFVFKGEDTEKVLAVAKKLATDAYEKAEKALAGLTKKSSPST